MKKGKFSLLIAVMVLTTLLLFPAGAFAEDQVIVEAVGFFSHFPMRATRQAIEDTCAKFGDKVKLTLYDETEPDGQMFMRLNGLSGHLPMRLFIDGALSFCDFVGKDWAVEELEKAITMALEIKQRLQKEKWRHDAG
ncbi:MAG: hypothetical protein FWF87_07990 [Synergistaceae bacterium]|nr:hypothetical protein [Synergistaceae bacterium]